MRGSPGPHAVNRHRATLGLDPLVSLTSDTDLSAGATGSGERSGFNKVSALQDIAAVSQYVQDHTELSAAADELTSALTELETDPSILDALKHRQLVGIGLPLVTDATCPLCDHVWRDVEDLRAHLETKLSRSAAAAAIQQRVKQAADRMVRELRRLRALIQAAQPHAVTVGRNSDQATLVDWLTDLASVATTLGTLESTRQQAARLKANGHVCLSVTITAAGQAAPSRLAANDSTFDSNVCSHT
jgi:hypothetical protein